MTNRKQVEAVVQSIWEVTQMVKSLERDPREPDRAQK